MIKLLILLPFFLFTIPGLAFEYKANPLEGSAELGRGYLIADNRPAVAPSVEALADKIIKCESSSNPNAIGDKDYPYQAYGLIQVQKRTWEWLGEKMGFEGDINDAEDQRRFLIMALEQGYGRYWTCFKKLSIEL